MLEHRQESRAVRPPMGETDVMALELAGGMDDGVAASEVVLADGMPSPAGATDDIALGRPRDRAMTGADRDGRRASRSPGASPSGATSPSAADIAVLKALMSSPGKDSSRLPNMTALGERLSAMLVRRLGALTKQEVQARIQEPSEERWRTQVAALPADVVGIVVTALPTSRKGLLWFDQALLFAILDDLLGGGGRAGVPMRRRERCCTAIEARLIERFSVPLLAEAAQAIAGGGGLELRFVGIETEVRRAEVGHPDDVYVMMPFGIELGPFRGSLGLVLPSAIFEALHRQPAGGSFPAEDGDSAAGWRRRLMGAAWELEIELAAILGERRIGLSEVASWLPGAIIDLALPLEAPVRLRCEDKDVAIGAVGRRQERLVVAIEHRLELGGEGP